MTLTIEVDNLFIVLAFLGAGLLVLSVLRGLEIVRLGNPVWLGASPLAVALNGVALFLVAIMSDVRNSGHDWLAVLCFLFFAGLVLSSVFLESLARADLRPNPSMQPPIDPVGPLADANSPSTPTASGSRHQVAE